jgi:arylsulfatase A-like enzyme
MPSSPPERPTPALAEQLLVGALTALVAGLADTIVCAARAGLGRVPPLVFLRAGASLVGMYLPLGLAVGAGMGLALALVRSAPWLDPLRLRLGTPSRWGKRDPEAFATGLAALVALVGLVLATQRAALHFATRYHDPVLAAWALAGVVIALGLGALLVLALVRRALRPVASLLGRVASLFTVLAVWLGAVIGGVVVVFVMAHRLFVVLDVVAMVWAPAAAVAYLLVATLVRRGVRGARPGRVRVSAALLIALSAGALVAVGTTYGGSHRARAVVERRAVLGQRLVRFYLDATDRDGDGYSFTFGGGDCNDGNRLIHPGAYDRPGDGVDQDCWGGDGSPIDLAALGTGAYANPRGTPPRPNILLITIDALRPDHVGAYGYARPTSPNLDAFARTAVRFDDVLAQSSRSLRSIPAFMTGFAPSQIEFGDEYIYASVLPSNQTLAETLAARGYATAVTMGTDYFDRTGGFFQGFADANQIPIYKPPRSRPMDDAIPQLQRLANGPQPWFQWVHLFNVHEEYLWDRVPSRFGQTSMDKYDSEIRFADTEVQRLLAELTRLGLDERTVVVIGSDHGEAFGEHDNTGHASTLYEEELRAVLMIRAPGIAPSVVREPVPLMDLMPTLLDLAHVPVPRPMPARSLVRRMLGLPAPAGDRPLYGELMPDGLYPFDVKSVRRGRYKLLWWVREGRTELYDLQVDPREQDDLSDSDPHTRDELLGLLRAWVAETNRPSNRDEDIVSRAQLAEPPARMTKRLDATFDSAITLLGVDLPRTTFVPNDRIPVTLYWRANTDPDASYFFELTFEGPPGFAVPPHFHAAHIPVNGRLPTDHWREGDIIRDESEIVVPHNIGRPVHLRMRLVVKDGGALTSYSSANGGGVVLPLAEIDIR